MNGIVCSLICFYKKCLITEISDTTLTLNKPNLGFLDAILFSSNEASISIGGTATLSVICVYELIYSIVCRKYNITFILNIVNEKSKNAF